MCPRTEYIAIVAPARRTDQSTHATTERSLCTAASPSGNQATNRRPIDCVPLLDVALVTSPHDVGSIPDARLGNNDSWRCRIQLDLPAKIRDVNTQVLLRAPELATPHGVEDLLVGQRAAAGTDERMQDLIFDRREMN